MRRTYGAHHLHFITCSCYRRLDFLRARRSHDCFLAILEETRQHYGFVVVGYVVIPEQWKSPLLAKDARNGAPSVVVIQLW
jgi:putative transposase